MTAESLTSTALRAGAWTAPADQLAALATAPALVRLEQKGWIKGTWGHTESNREAKFYAITKSGEKALTKEAEKWRRLAGLVDKLLLESE